MLEVKVLELILAESAPEIYRPLLLLEKMLEFKVNVPTDEYSPVESPSSLLLLYRKALPEKVVLAALNLTP